MSAVAFSPDGKTILNRKRGQDGGLVRGTPPPEGVSAEPLADLKLGVGAVAFRPDGKAILTGCPLDGEARLWDTSSGPP